MIEYTVRVYDDRTEWYLGDKLHRENGPALIGENGYKTYWIHDKHLTEEEFLKRTSTKEMTVKQLEKALGHGIKIVKE